MLSKYFWDNIAQKNVCPMLAQSAQACFCRKITYIMLPWSACANVAQENCLPVQCWPTAHEQLCPGKKSAMFPWSMWANIAQGNSLWNVGPWLTDNLSYQNNLYNVVSIKLGQHCLGISNIQCWLWLEQHNLFKSYRNSLNKIARLSKDNKNKLNKVWVGIKEIININKKTPYKLGTLTIMKSW